MTEGQIDLRLVFDDDTALSLHGMKPSSVVKTTISNNLREETCQITPDLCGGGGSHGVANSARNVG